LKTNFNLIETAQNTLISQSESILKLRDFINQSFENVINRIYNCEGRVIVSGIGKSAIIAQKMVATFNSTGTPAQFLHASEAVHGDLGMIQPKDLVIIISNSGNSPEIKILAPIVRNFGNILVAMTGNEQSALAKNANFVINTWIKEEACPNNLAPINSTTAQLVMGDVIAVCLMKLREFTAQDFAKYHPGGALGKKLIPFWYKIFGCIFIFNIHSIPLQFFTSIILSMFYLMILIVITKNGYTIYKKLFVDI
jgi:arabinose-5-phosphate isomerase